MAEHQPDPADVAAALAHRAAISEKHDPSQGKLHGCCVVCGVPWPCDTAKHFLRAAPVATENYGAVLASEINALPAKPRSYIHDLETRADPAFDVRRAFVSEENAAALAKRVEELEQELAALRRPVDMLLFCPVCSAQHIDAPDERTPDWSNPPHKSHLCHACGHVWRPCDRPTNGVATLTTAGSKDGSAAPELRRPVVQSEDLLAIRSRAAADYDYSVYVDVEKVFEALGQAQREIHDLRCPPDADGDQHACKVCGFPIRYGERHGKCGRFVMALEAEIARLSSPPPERADIVEREQSYRLNCGPFGHVSHEHGAQAFADVATLLQDLARARNSREVLKIERHEARCKLDRAEHEACALTQRIELLEGALQSAEARERDLKDVIVSAVHKICRGVAEIERDSDGDCMLVTQDELAEIVNDALLPSSALAAADGQQTRGRTPEQYAIEHGRYLATSARQFMDACNAVHAAQEAFEDCDDKEQEQRLTEALEDAQEVRGDAWKGATNSRHSKCSP